MNDKAHTFSTLGCNLGNVRVDGRMAPLRVLIFGGAQQDRGFQRGPGQSSEQYSLPDNGSTNSQELN